MELIDKNGIQRDPIEDALLSDRVEALKKSGAPDHMIFMEVLFHQVKYFTVKFPTKKP
jgi:hypothetical protein